MRVRYAPYAALLLLSCASETPADCAPPALALATRVELTGTCGPRKPELAQLSGTQVDGCTIERMRAECWMGGRIECVDGSSREWWADGSTGRWVGEDVWKTSSCQSTYRLELDPR